MVHSHASTVSYTRAVTDAGVLCTHSLALRREHAIRRAGCPYLNHKPGSPEPYSIAIAIGHFYCTSSGAADPYTDTHAEAQSVSHAHTETHSVSRAHAESHALPGAFARAHCGHPGTGT